MSPRLMLSFCLSLSVGFGACEPVPPDLPEEQPRYTYTVVNTYPHDTNAFTQGLAITDAGLFEGTGLYGASTLRRVALESGAVLQQTSLAHSFFGEGITVFGDRIYQVTWREKTGFIYDRDRLEQTRTFTYEGEGWGLTHDDEQLIMSDGTAWLRFLDPETLAETRRVEVRSNDAPVTRLNELEYINGRVFANVWQTDYMVIVDPDTGTVVSWVDLTGLLAAEDRTPQTDVLNGIAYDTTNGRLFVTGKRWPHIFEIELVSANAGASI